MNTRTEGEIEKIDTDQLTHTRQVDGEGGPDVFQAPLVNLENGMDNDDILGISPSGSCPVEGDSRQNASCRNLAYRLYVSYPLYSTANLTFHNPT